MTLEEHLAFCPRCQRRLEREAALRAIRQRDLPPPGDGKAVYTCMASPLGTLWIGAGPNGLLGISFAQDEAAFCHAIAAAGYGFPWYCPDQLAEVMRQIEEYFAGERTVFAVDLDFGGRSAFQRAVIERVRDIPYGSVRSYGEIAAAAGRPRAARAVGTVMAGNALSLVIPCHRVVRSDGLPGEYGRESLGACGTVYKAALLRLERDALMRVGRSSRADGSRSSTAAG
jgi:methylated-DNA-[protein]-cysteine S-methyltransferase